MKQFTTKLNERPTLKKIFWFVALYLLGIIAVGSFVFLMRIILGLPH
jgi:hypothetical protein